MTDAGLRGVHQRDASTAPQADSTASEHMIVDKSNACLMPFPCFVDQLAGVDMSQGGLATRK